MENHRQFWDTPIYRNSQRSAGGQLRFVPRCRAKFNQPANGGERRIERSHGGLGAETVGGDAWLVCLKKSWMKQSEKHVYL